MYNAEGYLFKNLHASMRLQTEYIRPLDIDMRVTVALLTKLLPFH